MIWEKVGYSNPSVTMRRANGLFTLSGVCVSVCVCEHYTHTHERSHTCMRCLASTAVSKDGQVMMPPPPWYIVTRHLWPCAVGRLRTGKHIQLVKWSCMLEVDVRHRLLTAVDI